MTTMAAGVAALALSVVACGGGSHAAETAGIAASCVAPQLSVTPTVAHAGGTVRASGKWFAADCYDTGQRGAPPALTNLRLQLTQSGHVWTLASGIAATGRDYTFHLIVTLPRDLQPGAAEIAVADHRAPVKIHVH